VPSHLPGDVRQLLTPVRLLVLDVDGVLTAGELLYSPDGELLKKFNVRDGLGISLLQQGGIAVGVITGRSGGAVMARCRDLGIPEEMVVLGSRNKGEDLDRLESVTGSKDFQVAAMGDDLPDIPLLMRAGLAVCPADATPEVAAVCALVLGSAGGAGAVREMAELILKAQGRWQELVSRWTNMSPGQG